ncbi:hopanoid-associated phosphorylase [Roseomonas sp. BN140053]|uniref:phosphorylase family protein n=1 Tax=Roseomonas sp. BN140053 TaxID=3391898 RepID=UPI0039E8ACA5
MTASPILVAVGLLAEARALPRGDVFRPLCAGGDPRRLGEALAAVAGEGARGVLSFGIAGGLDPALRPGTILLATEVCLPDGTRLPADPRWAAALRGACEVAGLAVQGGRLAAAAAVVAEPADKAALRAATGALAVDLESGVAARFAAQRRLPFAALRVVADAAGHRLPRAAVVGLTPDGRPDIPRVLAALLRRPGDLPDLLRTAARTAAAMRALRAAGAALGEGRGSELPRTPSFFREFSGAPVATGAPENSRK